MSANIRASVLCELLLEFKGFQATLRAFSPYSQHQSRDLKLYFLPVCISCLRMVQSVRMSNTQRLLWLPGSLCLMLCFFFFFSGAKERNAVPQLTDFEIPTSFWYELKSLTETLMDNVNREFSSIKLKHTVEQC